METTRIFNETQAVGELRGATAGGSMSTTANDFSLTHTGTLYDALALLKAVMGLSDDLQSSRDKDFADSSCHVYRLAAMAAEKVQHVADRMVDLH